MRQKSPELDIPEGVFYSEITGFNVYVKHKDTETGLLRDMMIYDYSEGFNKVSVMVADSGRLKTSADKMFLVLSLFNGESFRSLDKQPSTAGTKSSVPYQRETFKSRDILIEFDANFSRTDESFMQNQFMGKNMHDLQIFIDSVSVRLDSIQNVNAKNVYETSYKKTLKKPQDIKQNNVKDDSNSEKSDTKTTLETPKTDEPVIVMNFDSLYQAENPGKKATILTRAKSSIENMKADYFFKAATIGDEAYRVRRHLTEWHKKFTLSLACLFFFFIGAPLGAIIRKGGLGVPVVISVTIFIFYYIINVSGEKMAKSGEWVPWFGEWLSSMVLCPIGIFLTYKANKDSAVFNIEAYINVIRKILGLRISRHIARKEVIIHDPDYPVVKTELTALSQEWQAYAQKSRLRLPPNYLHIFFHNIDDHEVISLSRKMENLITILSNSRDAAILDALNKLPIVSTQAHTRPFHNYKWNMVLGIIFPVGIFFYFRIWRYRLRLYKDIQQIKKYSAFIAERIEKISEIE